MSKTIHNLHYEQIGKEVKCIEDELPFEIPDSWEWARLNSVGSMARGNGIKRNEVVENGYPCIRYGEIYTSYNLFFKDSISHVDNNIYNSSKKIKRNDLVYTLTGENKPDIAKTVAYLGEKDIAAGGDLAVWSNHQMNPLYLSYLLSSPYMISNKVKLATGDIIVHISVDKVGSFIAPIPPLEEQNRIVRQILILEELIKEYSEKEEELYKLNSNIKEQLKKSILQYAIEGKLVPQDSNDEPASVLLERIRKEKEKLIAEGKIKKDKSESIIYRRDNSYYEKQNYIENCIDDELPFEIPDSWRWTNIETISLLIGGKDNQILTKEIMPIGEIPVVSQSKKLIDGYCNNEDKKIDILPLVMFGDHTRNVKYIDFEFVVGADGTKFHKIILCNAKYIYYWMKHSAGIIRNRGYARHYSLLKECYIPLPPIQEQYRIVNEIETVLSKINTL